MSDTETVSSPEEGELIGHTGPPPTTEDAAIESISRYLNQDTAVEQREEQPSEDSLQDDAEEEGAQATESEAESEESLEVSSESEPEESVAEVASIEELPSTLSEFAEAIGVEPADLAGHIQVPIGRNDDGSVWTVSLAEAMQGYQRDSDYTRKTSEVANQRKQLETEREAAQQEWQSRLQQVDALASVLQSQLDTGMSDEQLLQLLEDDPQEYMRADAKRKAMQKAMQDAMMVRQQAMQEQQAEFQQQQIQTRQQEQQALYQHMPELKDQKSLAEFETGLTETLGDYGFGQEEVQQYMTGVFDHRVLRMAKDAMAYRKLQNGKKATGKKLKALPKVKKPGKSSERAKGRNQDARRNRMLKTGDTKDAVEFVKGLL